MIKIYKNSHLFSSSQSFGKVPFCLPCVIIKLLALECLLTCLWGLTFMGSYFIGAQHQNWILSESLLLRKDNVCVAITWSCLIVWWGLRILLMMRLFRWHNRTPGETLKCADFKNEPQLSLVSTTKKGRRWNFMWDSVCGWFVVHNCTFFLQRSQYKA